MGWDPEYTDGELRQELREINTGDGIGSETGSEFSSDGYLGLIDL